MKTYIIKKERGREQKEKSGRERGRKIKKKRENNAVAWFDTVGLGP